MATDINRPYSMDNFFRTAIDPNNNTILDPYTFFWTDLPYYLRDSIGQVRRIDVSKEGVPDLISYQEYGTHDLWWILSIANQMIVPEDEIAIGTNIYVPNQSDVNDFLTQINTRNNTLRLISFTPTPISEVGNIFPPQATPAPLPSGLFTLGQSPLGGTNVLG